MKNLAITAFLLLLATGCSSLRPEGVSREAGRPWFEAAEAIHAELQSDAYRDAVWAVEVVDLTTGQTVYTMNPSSRMIPASNTKLYTTATALDQLGADYTYTTRVVTDGSIADGTLTGDLVVVASGDPVIGGRFNDGDILATFRSWADSLRAHGVTCHFINFVPRLL